MAFTCVDNYLPTMIIMIGIGVAIGGLAVNARFKHGFFVRQSLGGMIFFPGDLFEPICLTEFLDKWVAMNDKPGQTKRENDRKTNDV